MNRLPVAAFIGAGALLATAPAASAEPRTITLTLLGGKTVTLTLDVPPGTPLDQISLPPLNTPVLTIKDSGPAPARPPVAVPESSTARPSPATTERKPAKGRAKSKRRRAPKVARSRAQDATHAPAAAVGAAHRRPRVAATPPVLSNPTFTVSVPSFFIEKFRVPPFLLPIYQAAGVQYGVRWELLAAINEIETDYGRNLNVSSAGALGWMQFMPATWRRYGVDANGDGKKDPYNPVDAIFAAARYLKAAGAEQDVRRAVFAYNHADWYVDSVLMRARLIGGTPAELVGSLTGLTQGRFPVAAPARYANGRRATNIFARRGAAVVAVQDAKVVALNRHSVRIRDVFGNTYAYGGLATVARTYEPAAARPAAAPSTSRTAAPAVLPKGAAVLHPPLDLVGPVPRDLALQAASRDVERRPLRVGSKVRGGTVLGRIGTHVRFRIRPVGKRAPLINPKPILDGWKLLESTAIYRASGKNPLVGWAPSIGQVLLMTKAQLQKRVLRNPRIEIYPGGRHDVRSGQIDRRVLATLEFLAASGLKPTVTSLKGNHGYYTASGNVSHHSSGNAVDIAKINGVPVIGHQGEGSITDIAVRRLLTLRGTMKPAQIISLMSYGGADNAISLPDHHDHIHVGFQPEVVTVLKPLQWAKLLERLGTIDNPIVAGGER